MKATLITQLKLTVQLAASTVQITSMARIMLFVVKAATIKTKLSPTLVTFEVQKPQWRSNANVNYLFNSGFSLPTYIVFRIIFQEVLYLFRFLIFRGLSIWNILIYFFINIKLLNAVRKHQLLRTRSIIQIDNAQIICNIKHSVIVSNLVRGKRILPPCACLWCTL